MRAAPKAVSCARLDTASRGSTSARARRTLCHVRPASGERGRGRGRELPVHGRDELPDLVIAVPQHGGEDLRGADVVGPDGDAQDAVVVARAGDFEPACRERPGVGQLHHGGVEPVAARAVADPDGLQGPAQQQPGLHTGDEHVLARHDVPDLVDQVSGETGPGLVTQWCVEDPQEHLCRPQRDVVVPGRDRSVGLGRDEVVVARRRSGGRLRSCPEASRLLGRGRCLRQRASAGSSRRRQARQASQATAHPCPDPAGRCVRSGRARAQAEHRGPSRRTRAGSTSATRPTAHRSRAGTRSWRPRPAHRAGGRCARRTGCGPRPETRPVAVRRAGRTRRTRAPPPCPDRRSACRSRPCLRRPEPRRGRR